MEIDSTSSPYDSQDQSNHSLNFDYLAMEGTAAAATSVTAASAAGASSSSGTYGRIDYSKALDRPFNLNERFVTILDQLDARVETFRKEALNLQEKKDILYMSMDLLKSNELLHNLNEAELEEFKCYMERVNARLTTVELHVLTVRDHSQVDSLGQVNELIDNMIKLGDPVMSRQRCQQFLNCCSTKDVYDGEEWPGNQDCDVGPFDKGFECALLGCTLDDQKIIKKRLRALMGYLNKQTIRS